MNEMKKTETVSDPAADLKVLQDILADIISRKETDAEHAKWMGDSTARDILDEVDAALADSGYEVKKSDYPATTQKLVTDFDGTKFDPYED